MGARAGGHGCTVKTGCAERYTVMHWQDLALFAVEMYVNKEIKSQSIIESLYKQKGKGMRVDDNTRCKDIEVTELGVALRERTRGAVRWVRIPSSAKAPQMHPINARTQ